MKPIVIMGATASGKTELALKIAQKYNGEIISADSKQIYKYLTAGTAKPAGTQINGSSVYNVEGVRYHLVDFLDPKSFYDAGKFVFQASDVVKDITARGKIPVFAGGTGLYIQAYWNGIDPLPSADPDLRLRLEQLAGKIGRRGLHAQLMELDPTAAESIPPGNIQRVIRALEVHKLTGIPISKLWSGKFHGTLPIHLALFVVLDWNSKLLHERIKARTRSSFGEWVEETRDLLGRGYPKDCPGLKSLGYPQVIDYLSGRLSQSEAIHRIVSLTNAYAKRQNTWFRRYRNVSRIHIETLRDWNTDSLIKSVVKLLEPVNSGR